MKTIITKSKVQHTKVICLHLILFTICFYNITTCVAQNIYTIVGTGAESFAGEGGQALCTGLPGPTSICVDGSGNIYIADGNRIRMINTSGNITTVAGNGMGGFSGDGGPATSAELNAVGICIDGSGNLYIADFVDNRIRMVNTSGNITTVAGIGAHVITLPGSTNTYTVTPGQGTYTITVSGSTYTITSGIIGDGGSATADTVFLNGPEGVSVDVHGNIYIADFINNRIRMVNTSGNITTVAGHGTVGFFSGDGGSATSARLNNPKGVFIDGSGNIYIADTYNNRIRMINTSGNITTVAGNGTGGFSGDGGPATSAELNNPFGVFVDGFGNIYIADTGNERIRKVSASTGNITTVAGYSLSGFSGDGGPATSAKLNSPGAAFVDGLGNIYFTDNNNNRVRKIDGSCISPDVPTISASNTTICNGTSTILSIATGSLNNAASWQWYNNNYAGNDFCSDIGVGSGISVIVSPTVTTTYAARGEGGCLTFPENTFAYIMIQVNSSPVINVGGNTTLCFGGSTNLYSNGASTYTWNPSTALSATNASVVTANPTITITYSITGTGVNGCTASETVIIKVNPLPTVPASGVLSFCQGDSVELSSNYANNQWSTGSTLQSIYVNTPGTFTLTVTDVNGCTGIGYFTTNENSSPSIPTISLINGNLISSSNIDNQWYLNGSIINGAVNDTYIPAQNGNYTVKITNSNGCSSVSAPYNMTALSIINYEKDNYTIYPNPFSLELFIDMIIPEKFNLHIYDMVGNLIRNGIFFQKIILQRDNLPVGLYIIKISDETGNNSFIRKISVVD